MKLFGSVLVLAAAAVLLNGSTQLRKPAYNIDVSWPNCGSSLPAGISQGIVGINGGLDFKANPCMVAEATHFKDLSLYVNTGYPGLAKAIKFKNTPKACKANDEVCIAYNYGYVAAGYDVKQALLHGVIARHWWLDVETENSWSDTAEINRADLMGMADFIKHLGPTEVGFYAYPGQWSLLTGDWQNGFPAWVATGSSDLNSAQAYCSSPSFNGGAVSMVQVLNHFDQNYPCKK